MDDCSSLAEGSFLFLSFFDLHSGFELFSCISAVFSSPPIRIRILGVNKMNGITMD
jgi:hypothetical protein